MVRLGLPALMVGMLGWAAVPAGCWRAVPPTPHDPASAVELAEKLSTLATLEKERGDHMSAWLFATAAAKALPGRKDLTVAALDTTKMLIPALMRDHVDAAAMALATDADADADADADTGAGGLAVAAVRKSQKEAWETAPDWLHRLKSQVEAILANPEHGEHTLGENRRQKRQLGELPQPTAIHSPFTTLVLQYNLGAEHAAGLSADAITAFTAFKTSRTDALMASDPDAGAGVLTTMRLNNDFFEHQVNHKGVFTESGPFKRIEATFRAAVADFWIRHGMSPSVAKRRAATRRVDSWASMHGTGSSHARHSHFASSVSGSFYARVPNGSGRLRFHDPRGENKVMKDVYGHGAPSKYGKSLPGEFPALPPFTGPYAVPVHEGLLVLFPSWLAHEVETSDIVADAGYRISFAFNMAGDWHDTSMLTLDLNRTRSSPSIHKKARKAKRESTEL